VAQRAVSRNMTALAHDDQEQQTGGDRRAAASMASIRAPPDTVVAERSKIATLATSAATKGRKRRSAARTSSWSGLLGALEVVGNRALCVCGAPLPGLHRAGPQYLDKGRQRNDEVGSEPEEIRDPSRSVDMAGCRMRRTATGIGHD